jgi:hypothetical protein
MNQTTLPMIAQLLFLLSSADAKPIEPTSLLRETD